MAADEIDSLRALMARAAADEDFETAVGLRDRIAAPEPSRLK